MRERGGEMDERKAGGLETSVMPSWSSFMSMSIKAMTFLESWTVADERDER